MEKSNKILNIGFNHGYILAKYLPSLTTELFPSLSKNNSLYKMGFESGIKEYLHEKKLLKKHEVEQPTKKVRKRKGLGR
ncbi:MAG: hypothetical protein H6578_10210 [Chitinophagales bacterium]|nr:hypothetical protein [Chitinophagales bacterium]